MSPSEIGTDVRTLSSTRLPNTRQHFADPRLWSFLAPSSSGLGRCPLKAEITGSNPVGAATFPSITAFVAVICLKTPELLLSRHGQKGNISEISLGIQPCPYRH